MYDNSPLVWLLILALIGVGTFSCLVAWFRGDIFAGTLAWFESLRDADPGPNGGLAEIGRFFGELMTCPLCLSYHVSFWLSVYACAFGYLPWPMVLFGWWAGQTLGHFLYRRTETPPPDPLS